MCSIEKMFQIETLLIESPEIESLLLYVVNEWQSGFTRKICLKPWKQRKKFSSRALDRPDLDVCLVVGDNSIQSFEIIHIGSSYWTQGQLTDICAHTHTQDGILLPGTFYNWGEKTEVYSFRCKHVHAENRRCHAWPSILDYRSTCCIKTAISLKLMHLWLLLAEA